jgi:predicted Zn-dependent protease with MMP-like domain
MSNLDQRHGAKFRSVEISVDLIPTIRDLAKIDGEVALGRLVTGTPNRVILYRRPIEVRSQDEHMRMHIIKDVLAEKLGELWSMSPNEVDPDYLGPSN